MSHINLLAMIYGHNHYRSFLKASLAERISSNPVYSARAFARQLGIAASTLSEVLSGAKNLSPASALKVAHKLGLAPEETDYFCQLVQFESARDPELKARLAARLDGLNGNRRVSDLSVDVFKMISDWYHLPILELTRLEDFVLTPQSAVERLGITRLEAEVAIERLERLELLLRDAQGRLVKAEDFWVAQANVPNAGLRNFHRQMLTRAIESLETQSPQEKFVGSETFPLDPAQLNEAGQIMDRFLTEMAQLSARAKRRREVYHLGAQLFRLTKPQSPKIQKEKSK